MSRGMTLAKPREHLANEDAILVAENCIAVSDGAGGCGVFADEWSAYLLANLPQDRPLTTYEELNEWIDQIWEPFYEAHEEKAKLGDAMLVQKYYNEGSFATLAAAWKINEKHCRWMSYGDSVVFHYSPKDKTLEHSFTQLADFSMPPHLINCKDPLAEDGFRSGVFELVEGSVVFAASDALSHYILMCYELAHCGDYYEELIAERNSGTTNGQLLAVAEQMPMDFDKVLKDLLASVESAERFESHMLSLQENGVLDKDDYSLVVLG